MALLEPRPSRAMSRVGVELAVGLGVGGAAVLVLNPAAFSLSGLSSLAVLLLLVGPIAWMGLSRTLTFLPSLSKSERGTLSYGTCRSTPSQPLCPVDVQWLSKEGQVLGSAAGTPRRPLLAGGSGLVGSNLLVLLANSPGVEKVRVLDMFPPNKAVIAGIEDKIEFVKGRFAPGEYDRLKSAAEGCDCVFMVFTPNVHRAKLHEFYETNVDGARELTKACIDAGVTRIVYASSIAVSSMAVQSFNQSESVPFPPIEEYDSPYDITKRKGEELVLEATKSNPHVLACALRFGGILLGPRDFFFDYIWPAIPGLILVPMGSIVDWMDGRDVSRALLMAAQGLAEKPAEIAGQSYWCTGIRLRPGELAQITARCLEFPFMRLPMDLLPVVCWVWYLWYYIRAAVGIQVPGVREDQIFAAAFTQKTFDNSKVRKDLGFETKVALEDSCSRIVDLWLAENGFSRGPSQFLIFLLGSLIALVAVASTASKLLR